MPEKKKKKKKPLTLNELNKMARESQAKRDAKKAKK